MAEKGQSNPGRKLLNRIQNQIKDIKSELSQSEKQAMNSLKTESKHFQEEVHKAETQLDKLEQYSKNDAKFLKRELHHLEDELKESVQAKSTQDLADTRYKIDRTFNRFRDRAKSSFRNASAKLKNSWDKIVDSLDRERKDLDNHIELHRLQFEHEEEGIANRLKIRKEQLSAEIGKLEQRIEESLASKSPIQVQHRASEISQKFRDFKNRIAR